MSAASDTETAVGRIKRGVIRAHELVRINHAEGRHPDHRDYCPDCRYERGIGEERR